MTAGNIIRGTEGKRRFVRQQDTEKRPYTNCRIVVGLMQCIFAGLEVRDDDAFVRDVRRATGVAEVTDSGRTQGTSAADFIRGMAVVAPWVEINFVAWNPGDLFLALRDRTLTACLAIGYADSDGDWILPARLRKSSPRFKGKHAFLLNGGRIAGGRMQARWVNCLDPRGSEGTWEDWDDILRWAKRSGQVNSRGAVFATTIGRYAGVRDTIIPDRVYSPPAKVEVPKDADVFHLDEDTNELIRDKNTTRTYTTTADCTVTARRVPKIPPTGGFARIVSGGLKGKYVRTSQVTITPQPGGDCAVQIAAAVAPLEAEIAERDLYIQRVRAVPVPD